MQFYAAAPGGSIAPGDLKIFADIRTTLEAMPDIVFDSEERGWDGCKNQVTCHLLCRALAMHFKVSVRDGHFVNSYQHSWLIPVGACSIIDAYPVAGAAPFIVANDSASPWSKLYRESDVLRPKFETEQFRERLDRTIKSVGATLQRLGL